MNFHNICITIIFRGQIVFDATHAVSKPCQPTKTHPFTEILAANAYHLCLLCGNQTIVPYCLFTNLVIQCLHIISSS